MKQKLLSLIVLFLVGSMTRAQLLPATQLALQPEKGVRSDRQAKALLDEFQPNYWVAAKAYYNMYGEFLNGELQDLNYQAQVDINGTEATIRGIVDLSNFYVISEDVVKGVYDPEARTVTVSTPAYSEGRPFDEYTHIATVSYYGSDMELVLFTGDFVYIESAGSYGVDTESKLVFDVAEDMKTITPRTGYGAYAFFDVEEGRGGFANFYKTATWTALNDEAQLLVQPSVLHIEGVNVTAGATVTRNVLVSNMGKKGTNVTAKAGSEELQVEDLMTMGWTDALSTSVYEVTFTPTKEGLFESTIEFTDDNGQTAVMEVRADVAPAPDFSAVVKRGDLHFAYSDDFPFAITDTITGFPVAVSTNELADNSTSTLLCKAYVPEGKTGILSWKGMSSSMQPNGLTIYENQTQLFDNVYAYSGTLGKDDVSNTVVLTAGENTIRFVNSILMNWYDYGFSPEPFKTYLYDFDFQLVDITEHAALAKTDAADFGSLYVDKFAMTDTATVVFVNLGSEPLEVLGFEGNENFSGVVDGRKMDYGRELAVRLLFTYDKPGTYESKVTVVTTAGNFDIDCRGVAEALPVDYSPIVAQGDFSFDTSHEHPFTVNGSSASSSIAFADMYNVGVLESWLEAYFLVPEGKVGQLSWEGNNSSAGYFDFMGSVQHNDGTIITLDGTLMKDYAGEMDASSTTFDEADLTFGEGLHKVKFLYRKIYSTPEGLDRFKLKELSLKLSDASGVEQVTVERPVKREFYNAEGKRIGKLQPGVNILRETYADGKVVTKKVVR